MMNNFVIIYLTLICLQLNIRFANSENNFSSRISEEQSVRKSRVNTFATSVRCNTSSLIAEFVFEEPFFGIIYVKGFPLKCRSGGNGSKVVHFESKSNECGVRQISNEYQPSNSEYELVFYVQNDPNIQQASDERIEVKCAPQELLLTGVVGNQLNQHSSKFNGKSLFGSSHIHIHQMRSHNFTLTDISNSLDCRMDVMKGRMPFLKPIDGFVDLGQDVTIMIKIREIAGIDTMLSRCYAHDGTHAIKQELTNNDGCAVDSNILPNFNLIYNSGSESKVYYTTFPAFKFPDKTNLNIQCTVIICNTTCPQIQCDNTTASSPQLHRIKRLSNSQPDSPSIITKKRLTQTNNNDSNTFDSVLSEIGISNSLGVKTLDSINNAFPNHVQNITSMEKIFANELVSCLTSQVILTLGLLLTVFLLVTLILACYCGMKVQELNQKISNTQIQNHAPQPSQKQDIQTFSYGRMVDLTN